MAMNGYTSESQTLSSLVIFSYPNSTDVEIKLAKYLFDHNEIKIANINLELRNLCNMENNIFGYILTGLEILEIYKTSSEYLYNTNTNEEISEGFLTLDNNFKLKIEKVSNIYNTFSYGIKYTCLATEPEYDEYNDYTIAFISTDKTIFDSYKKTYYGRNSYYYFTLDYKLTEMGCDQLCELCYYTENSKCVTCSFDFKYSNDKKICYEGMTTIIETTIPEKIETTIPEKIETTLPEIMETTLPGIKTSIPEIILTNKIATQEILCSTKEIIQGICDGELTDEMAEDIYLYITANLINTNALENNLIIKTPNVAFQLSSYDDQKKNNDDLNISIVDLGECENKLREKYLISEEYDLLFFKIDIQNPNKTLTYVQYEVYHPETFEQLNLDVCQDIIINISVPANLNSDTILLYQSLNDNG